MSEFILIAMVAFLASLTTFFSGFGLGTILTPFFCLFFSVPDAIALTALVHFSNNLFKFSILQKHIVFKIAIPFAVTAVVASFTGATLLEVISHQHYSYQYFLGGMKATVTPIKLLVAGLMILFVIVEQFPDWSFEVKGRLSFLIGGLVSGFFGGLSGNQGALRSMFLLKAGLKKESYLATGVFIACMVDISRLSIYIHNWKDLSFNNNLGLMIVAVLCALVGSLMGKRYIQKVTLKSMQSLVVVLLTCIAVLLGFGII